MWSAYCGGEDDISRCSEERVLGGTYPLLDMERLARWEDGYAPAPLVKVPVL